VGEFFGRLFSSDYMPHGHCFFWQPSLVWMHVISDSLITAAYYSIPVTLYYFIRKRTDLKLRGLILMFAGFILACGTTHLLSVWDIWHSAYRLEGLTKAITAALSIVTAIATIRLAPVALNIATPEQIGKINETLREEIAARTLAEEKLRRHLDAQLLASEDKLHACFEAASQAILGVSSNGRISLVNRRTEEMFGYSREELLGQELELLLPERFRNAHNAHRNGYFLEPRVRAMGAGMELSGRRKDGTEFPIEIGLSHVSTPEGPLAFGMVSDISERKKAADDLKRANEDLRHSNTEMEQFAHVASHDLQEPLRMVTGYLQLIERRYADRLNEDGKEFIRFAVEGAKRMKALIRDLLEFSRAGTHAANFREIDTRVILDNALANLKTAIDESAARITCDFLPAIVGDPVLLIQVFQNLIANAIKFQKGTAPSIHISARREGREWIFSVRDNGIGIESRHLERIFRIFERLHSIEDYSGSGIGLAITRKIVERHRGRIWVESELGAGSTFFFAVSSEMVIADEKPKLSLGATP
jgi:two-component system sensor kinase FixL